MFPLCLGFTWTVVPCSATDRPAFCQGRNAKRGRMILDPPAAGPSVVDRLEVVDLEAALGGPVARASHLATSRWAARWGWVPIVAVTTAVVRVPLLGLPLDPDEGGYAYVAHRWAAGAQLYTTAAWVDRPPALMLVFRWITDLSYSPIALRLAAVLAAMVVALGAGACARTLAGPRAGLVAGLLAGVVLAGQFVEGYQLNGELLASAVGTWGVAVAVMWRQGERSAERQGERARRRSTGWLLLAGVLAGTAPLVKQSAIDALVAVLAVAVAHAVRTRRPRALVASSVGAAVPLVLAVAWGAATGWSRAWYAVVAFQAQVAQSQSLGHRVGQLASSVRHVLPDLLGLLVAATVAAVLLVRQGRRLWPVPVWLAAAVLAAATGPFGHPHYWVQAVAPLSVLAASAVPSIAQMDRRLRRVAITALAAAVLIPVVGQVVVLARPAASRPVLLTGDRRQAADTAIADWLRAHDPVAGQVFAFVGAAETYLDSGRGTGYPYLWYEPVQHVPGALPMLGRWLASNAGPRYVVVFQSPRTVDPSGGLTRILARDYTLAVTIDGYRILARR